MSSVEILNSVNEFYTSAWNMLIIYTSILLAVVGVIIPLILTWWQNRTLKFREEALKNELQNIFDVKVKKLNTEFSEKVNEMIDEKLNKTEDFVSKKVSQAVATSFHIQGSNFLKQKDYFSAIRDYLYAGNKYLIAEDHLNLTRVNKVLLNNIKHLNSEMLYDLKLLDCGIEDYINAIQKNNTTDVFTEIIRKLKKSVHTIKKKPN